MAAAVLVYVGSAPNVSSHSVASGHVYASGHVFVQPAHQILHDGGHVYAGSDVHSW